MCGMLFVRHVRPYNRAVPSLVPCIMEAIVVVRDFTRSSAARTARSFSKVARTGTAGVSCGSFSRPPFPSRPPGPIHRGET